MTIFKGTFLDTPSDPFAAGALRVEEGALLRIDAGKQPRVRWLNAPASRRERLAQSA